MLTQCVAPKGYYYLRGKAVACAQGTYKDSVANADCSKCPTGFSTSITGSITSADCKGGGKGGGGPRPLRQGVPQSCSRHHSDGPAQAWSAAWLLANDARITLPTPALTPAYASALLAAAPQCCSPATPRLAVARSAPP